MPHAFLWSVRSYATRPGVRRSSIGAALALLGVTPVTPLGAQVAPTAAQLDSLRLRVEDAEAAIAALREQLATEASSALRTRSRVALEFHGRALVHLLSNSAPTNNVDVPTFVAPSTSTAAPGGIAMTIRQTTLGLAFSASGIAGGTFQGDLDVDFYGGQQPSSGGRTFPLVRLRTARGTLAWRHGSVMAGQEQPLITNVDPVSLAAVGVPGFTAAGNLWLWLPQVRAAVQTAGRVRIGLEAAVLAPTSGDPAGLFDTDFDAAERTGTPFTQALVRLAWGADEAAGFITLGAHSGRIRDANGMRRESEALALSAVVPLGGVLELRGEAFDGQALRGLGGGGIGQGLGLNGVAVRTTGAWGQLNARLGTRWTLGGGYGVDDPEDADLAAGARLANRTVEGHVHWRPAGPVVLGLEWRQSTTEYAAERRTNRHLNAAIGFQF